MKETLGTCKAQHWFSSGTTGLHLRHQSCVDWKAGTLSPTPATDALNQSIRDVTEGRKKIRVMHPEGK